MTEQRETPEVTTHGAHMASLPQQPLEAPVSPVAQGGTAPAPEDFPAEDLGAHPYLEVQPAGALESQENPHLEPEEIPIEAEVRPVAPSVMPAPYVEPIVLPELEIPAHYTEPAPERREAQAIPENPYVDPTTAQLDEPVAVAAPQPEPVAATPAADDPESTGPIPVEAVLRAAQTRVENSGNAPAAPGIDLDSRPGSSLEMGADTRLSWAARTDVGLVRGHNEDSYLSRAPLFGVCDGMGGHAAGEVASAIAVRAIGEHAPEHADDALLGAAVEAANEAVITGAATGAGKPGMGCTASCCLIEDDKLAVAHVGDSRIYLLRAGVLVRLTHDHSYVEELVDAGEITPDEARVHPSRSIITRALGSDPDMYADHFSLDVERGDRLVVCSDGLSSMVSDSAIESLCLTSPTARDCVDALVSAALVEGGHDNVTVIVVDVVSDGHEEARRKALARAVAGWVGALVAVVALVAIVLGLIVHNSWYVGTYAGRVGIYQGVRSSFLGISLSSLEETSDVSLVDLPEATQHQLAQGITVASNDEARSTVEAYRAQIEEDRAKKQKAASDAQSESSDGTVGAADGAAGPASTESAPEGASTSPDQASDATQPQGGE